MVLYRHEKTFYNKPGLFVKLLDTEPVDTIAAKVRAANAYQVNYVGIALAVDGFAVEAASGDGAKFQAAVKAVRSATKRPLALISHQPAVMAEGLKGLGSGETPLICGADSQNWEAMSDLAKQYKAALTVSAANLDEMADLTEKIKAKGVEDLALDPQADTLGGLLALSTQIRRLALKKNFRAVGYPVVAFPQIASGCYSGDR